MSNTLDQCQVHEIEFKSKNDILPRDIYLPTTATSCQKSQPKKLLNDDKRSDSNSLIIVILFVIMNIINYIDRFTLAGKYFFRYIFKLHSNISIDKVSFF